MTYSPGSVKQDRETKSVATRCGPSVSAGEWFVFNPDQGGHYATLEDVESWADMVVS